MNVACLIIISSAMFLSCAQSVSEKKHVKRVNPNSQSPASANNDQPNEELVSFRELVNSGNAGKMPKWVAAVYQGLKLGDAVEQDVIGKFGNPKYKGKPFNEESDTSDLRLLAYEDIANFNGRTEFIFSRESGKLVEIWLSPNYRHSLSRRNAIFRYGTDYFVRSYKDPCSDKMLKDLSYPYTVVYPKQGMYLLLRKNQVDQIIYTASC